MEVIWTILPILILIIIAFRSFKRLYFIAEIWNPIFLQLKQLAINDIDRSYEYPDFTNIEVDFYIIN